VHNTVTKLLLLSGWRPWRAIKCCIRVVDWPTTTRLLLLLLELLLLRLLEWHLRGWAHPKCAMWGCWWTPWGWLHPALLLW
jgi:hypothetical protein